jgi:hypothetical protein
MRVKVFEPLRREYYEGFEIGIALAAMLGGGALIVRIVARLFY